MKGPSALVRWLPVVGIVAVTAHPLAGAGTAEPAAVGIVSEYSPVTARYVLKRGGDGSPQASIPVRIGTVVMAGDEIALPAKGAVTYSAVNGAPRKIEGPGSFRVPEGDTLGWQTRVWQAMVSVFDVEYRTAATAVSRGGQACAQGESPAAIVVPILRAHPRIVAGVRDIPLAWTGGCPPYSVTLTLGTTTVARKDDLAKSQVRFDAVRLVAGTVYAVVIVDARGTRREIALSAATAAPTPPADLASDSTSLGTTARALWLADQEAGAWRLDSFDMLRPLIRAGDPMAGRVGDVLLWQDVDRLLDAK